MQGSDGKRIGNIHLSVSLLWAKWCKSRQDEFRRWSDAEVAGVHGAHSKGLPSSLMHTCGLLLDSQRRARPGRVPQGVGLSSCMAGGGGFHSWSGRVPRLRGPFLVGVCMGGNRVISLSLALTLSLSSIKTYLQMRIKKIAWLVFSVVKH